MVLLITTSRRPDIAGVLIERSPVRKWRGNVFSWGCVDPSRKPIRIERFGRLTGWSAASPRRLSVGLPSAFPLGSTPLGTTVRGCRPSAAFAPNEGLLDYGIDPESLPTRRL